MNSKVAVIILNWNGWEDTIECLESVFQIQYPHYQVFLVDNNSEDESVEKIRSYCEGKIKPSSGASNEVKKPLNLLEISDQYKGTAELESLKQDIVLIKNKKNYGFAGGNNIGMGIAKIIMDPDYFLLLNNDTVVDSEFLNYLVEKGDENQKNGFMGPKTYFYDKPEVIQAAGGGKVDFQHGESIRIAHDQSDHGQFDMDMGIDYVMGSCLLVKRAIADQIGFLDEKFFMYWEDVDWCFRGSEQGYKSLYVHQSKIWHKEGTSSETTAKNYYHTRNRLIFTRRHASKIQYSRFLIYFLLFIGIERSYHYWRIKDLKMYRYMLQGLIDGLKGNMGVMNMKMRL
jgi:GT2 family glycosyltransferase